MRSRERRFGLALASACVGAWLLAAGAAGADLAEIQKRGTLRVVVVDGSPAFFRLQPGADPGFDRELLDGFAALHKLTVQPVTAPSWNALLPWLLEGKGDVVAGGVTLTPARAKQIDFTTEVFPSRHVVVTRKPNRVVERIEQLREERVGTIKGSSMAEVIATLGVPAANLDEGLVSGGAPDALRKGRITATVSGIEDAFLYQRADPAIQIGMFVGPAASLAFGVRRDSPKLKAALDEYVGNVRRTPTWSRLVLKYFGDQAPELLKKARQ
jgi:membrane-bound lytic murein transglycosylase F